MSFTPVIPITGLGGLRLLDETRDAQLEALKADPQVSRNTAYFRENIASATTSDALLADRRLLEVALTAYGLESEIGNTAFIKQVLDGGTSNSSSFANRLNDPRWLEFTRDFGYGDPGAGQEVSGFQAAVEVRFLPDGTPDPTLNDIEASRLATFRANIDGISSIDDLLADPTTLDVALEAFGLERGFYNDNHFRVLLTEGPEGPYARSLSPASWVSFTRAFSGLADGASVEQPSLFEMEVNRGLARLDAPPLSTQTAADADPNRISDAEFNTFNLALQSATTPAEALANDVVIDVARVAFGVGGDADTTTAETRQLLLDAAAGDLSGAVAKGEAYVRLAQAFQASFDNSGAKVFVSAASNAIERAIADRDLETLPFTPQPTSTRPSAPDAELAYFREQIAEIETAAELVSDARLMEVALTAFGLQDETRPTDAELVQILEQNPDDILATIQDFENPAWRDLALSFQPPNANSPVIKDIWRYGLDQKLNEIGTPQEDIDYFRRNFDLVDLSIDIVIDPRLGDIVMSAFGIEKDAFGANFILNVLTSDLDEPSSFVNAFGDQRFKDMASFFDGGPRSNVQLEGFADQVLSDYHTQLFEVGVGQTDQDLRLALNFRREIAEIATSETVAEVGFFNVLASEPLRTVMDRVFSLPPQFAQLDINAQEQVYRSRAQSVFGGSDPSVFLDSANVEEALQRFLATSTTGAQFGTAPILTLMSQTANFAAAGFNRTF
ncbi:MAG: DUF1217 domain-containing protein [Pseudomonadota bacterium]